MGGFTVGSQVKIVNAEHLVSINPHSGTNLDLDTVLIVSSVRRSAISGCLFLGFDYPFDCHKEYFAERFLLVEDTDVLPEGEWE